MDVSSLSREEILKIDSNTLIFSGLYGFLSILNRIKPYRLDVANKLENEMLYKFWENKGFTDNLAKFMKENEKSVLLNLASKEYSKMLSKTEELEFKIVDCEFGESLSSYDMKYFRGKAAKHIGLSGAKTLEELSEIDDEHFEFCVENEKLVIKIKNYNSAKRTKT